jgi:hypothetical protein
VADAASPFTGGDCHEIEAEHKACRGTVRSGSSTMGSRSLPQCYSCSNSLLLIQALSITTSVFERISPNPTIYNFGVGLDFTVLGLSASGEVTAAVLAIPDQGMTSGCEAADFAGFSAGSIALIARGTCPFSDKVANAAAAGALAA